jgi:predicted phosphodiesterase
MKVLIIGDCHLKITNLLMGKQFLTWIASINELHKPDLVVNLGDFFDQHAVIRSEILAEYGKHISQICDASHSPTYVHILGNHELYKPNSSEYHALQSLKGLHANYKVADAVDSVILPGFSFIPYCHDESKFPSKVNSICFAHQTFVGADFGNFRPENGVDADLIDADLIVSGHIHKGQTFSKVFYPGSPFAQDANDVDQIKGIYILDSDTLKYTLIPSPMPRFRGLTVAATDDSGILNIDAIHTELVNALTTNDHWIINLSGPKAELVAYQESKPFLELKKQYSMRMRVKYTDSDKERVQIKALSVQDAICQYIDKIYNGDLDKTNLKDRVFKILESLGQ